MKKDLGNTFFRAVLDALPSPVFIVNEDLEVQACNTAALPLIGKNPSLVLQLRSGEALHCIHSTDSDYGCGQGEQCKTCILRNSVAESCSGGKVIRRAAKMRLSGANGWSDIYLLVTAAPLTHRGSHYTVLTLENINELIELRKLIPICANCKRIRNEQAFWSTLETYFKHHMDLDFTHSICPECFEKLYPELVEKRKSEGIGDL